MVCGTASDVGKSAVVTGLCRLLARSGVRVAPFKAQNMSLNSFVAGNGGELSRAQAAQALACGVEPEVSMNPVLLKPTGVRSSQLIVMGRPIADVEFLAYRSRAPELRPVVFDALRDLRSRFDVVVCEGAGGAAEINLLDDDIVNLPLACAASLSAIVVGDIERGGVFASLFGTFALLPSAYRSLVQGFVINKMRGDASILEPGLRELQARTGVPTLGVLPWLADTNLDAEDSLGLHAAWVGPDAPAGADTLDVAVVAYPHISNFTDVDPLRAQPGVNVRFETTAALGDPDLLILPGTKATVADLEWMRANGLDRAVIAAATRPGGPLVLGICGGLQILGADIVDDVESRRGRVEGFGLLDVNTMFEEQKVTRQRWGHAFGQPVTGYQIHHGRVRTGPRDGPWLALAEGSRVEPEGSRSADGRVLGTTLHGLFESDAFRTALLALVADGRGKRFIDQPTSFADLRRRHHDRLADTLEANLHMPTLEAIIRRADRLGE
jgi:adenosylcobyric acid synthase